MTVLVGTTRRVVRNQAQVNRRCTRINADSGMGVSPVSFEIGRTILGLLPVQGLLR